MPTIQPTSATKTHSTLKKTQSLVTWIDVQVRLIFEYLIKQINNYKERENQVIFFDRNTFTKIKAVLFKHELEYRL